MKAIGVLVGVITATRVVLAVEVPAGLSLFRPGEVSVGGEIGERLSVTVEKMIRHTDVENTFVRHFRTRKEKPDEPGGFAGYGMYLERIWGQTPWNACKIRLSEGLSPVVRCPEDRPAGESANGAFALFLHPNRTARWRGVRAC